MASVAKLLFGVTQEHPSPKQAGGKAVRRWSSDDQQRRAAEEARRSSLHTQQKAERALMREHLRDKYKLAKNAEDQRRLREAGGKVRMSRDLRAIIQREEPEEPDLSFTSLLSQPGKMEAPRGTAHCLLM